MKVYASVSLFHGSFDEAITESIDGYQSDAN